MNLEFISISPTGDAAPAVSPFASAAERAGGQLEARNGWLIPISFSPREQEREAAQQSVAFADISALTKTELQGGADVFADCADGELSVGVAVAHEGAWWCRLTPTRVLVLGRAPADS